MPPVLDGVLTPVSELLPADLLPTDLFSFSDGSGNILDRIYVLESSMVESEAGTLLGATLAFEGEIAIGIPACPSLTLIIGAGIPDFTVVPIKMLLAEDWWIELDSFQVALRVDKSVLRPADPARQFTEIALTTTVRVGPKGIEFPTAPAVSLPKSFLGDTDVAIEAANLKFDFWRDWSIPEVTAAGLGDQFMGVYIQNATIYLPPDLNVPLPAQLAFTECFIGNGGFTGSVAATWAQGVAAGKVFGYDVELRAIALSLRESSFVEASITGLLSNIPFFDAPAFVDFSFGAGGRMSVGLSAQQPAGVTTSPVGLVRLTIPNVVQFDLESIALEHDESATRLYLAGIITPLIAGNWPGLELKRLGIDSNGKITIEGGWIDLPDQYAIDLDGFQLELSKIGFGSVEGSPQDHWFGLTGGIRLTEALPAGVSVDGLRVEFGPNYPQPSVSFNGIGLEFGVPDVFRFAGKVAYTKDAAGSIEYRGSAKLELYSLDVSIEVQIVVGHNAAPSFNFCFLVLDAKLCPSGIPLFSTGLALYGFAGMYVQHMRANVNVTLPQADQWYEWWKRNPQGVTDNSKWIKSHGDFAVGVGVLVGTQDTGFTLNVKGLLLVMLPQPVIMIDAKANFLKKASTSSSGGEGAFHAMALYDSRAGIVELAIDATYKIPWLLDARADSRAHFEANDSDAWYVEMGKESPKEKRASAHLFGGLVDGWMYLRIDPELATFGAGIEFKKKLSAGPAWIKVEASASIVTTLRYTPAQLEITGRLVGSARAGIKGVKIGVSVNVSADLWAPKPFLIRARFRACADLWIKTVCVSFPFELSRQDPPPIAPPVAGIALRHPHPVRESGGTPPPSTWPLELGTPSALPARTSNVPMDALIDVSLLRQAYNQASGFVNGDSYVDKWHRLGDQSRYRYQYRLTDVRLYDEGMGSSADIAAALQVTRSGAWQNSALANTVLEVGATTPFSGSSASLSNFVLYDPDNFVSPCDELPPPDTELVCKDVTVPRAEAEAKGWKILYAIPSASQQASARRLTETQPATRVVPSRRPAEKPDRDKCRAPEHRSLRQILLDLIRDRRRVVPLYLLLLFVPLVRLMPSLREGRPLAMLVLAVAIVLYLGTVIVAEWLSDEVAFIKCGEGCRCRGYGRPCGGTQPGDRPGHKPGEKPGEEPGGKPGEPGVPPGDDLVVVRLCEDVPVTDGQTRETPGERVDRLGDWVTEIESWSAVKPILKPNTCYRVEVDVTTVRDKDGNDAWSDATTTVARFRTGGPPTLLGSLEPYMLWTQPAFTPGKPGRRAFRAYDLGVLFNETYLDVMYIASGDNLELRLFDNNGDPILDGTGAPVVLPNSWGYAPERVLTREENVVTRRLEAGQCLPTIDWQAQSQVMTSPAAAGVLLRPETYYEVQLARVNDATKTPLARYSFVTSRFETFAAMIESFDPTLALPHDGSTLSSAVLASGDFNTLAGALPLLPSPRPERMTITPLRVGGATVALLLLTPEPIEWVRVDAFVYLSRTGRPPYSGNTLRVVASEDETAAFLICLAGGQPVTLPDLEIKLRLRFRRSIGAATQIYAVNGDTSTEDVTSTFTLGPPA